MASKRGQTTQIQTGWMYSTRLHAIMYSFLLVVTPFILLQNFLVEAIGNISTATVELFGYEIPVIPVIALVFSTFALIVYRSYITKLRVLAVVIVILLIGLTQQITDYYFGHNFYDLQQNWHYIAYGIFSFMVYRDLLPRGFPLAKIMLITFFSALLFSTFDETFQMKMSARIFDMSDIAKDVWGTLMGMVICYLGGSKERSLLADRKRIRHPKLRQYLKHPFSLLILLTVFTLLFIIFSSLFADFPHWKYVILLTVGCFSLFFFAFHISQFKWGKYGLIVIAAAGLLVQSYFFLKYRSDHIVHSQFGLTVYKGIPILFFDVLIFPDGTFRLVDKKHYFNNRDRTFFLKQKTDIIIIGNGINGNGGNGFPEKTANQFLYNKYIKRGTQVIILKTPQACKLFDKLKKQNKNVLFVIHSTC